MQDIISLYRSYSKFDVCINDDLISYLSPSIFLNQYKKHYYKNELIGFTNWAFLSDEAQKRFKKEGWLKAEEWLSGNHIWHIETICKRNLKQIIKWTKRNFTEIYGAGKPINWLRVDNDKEIRNVVKIHTKESWL